MLDLCPEFSFDPVPCYLRLFLCLDAYTKWWIQHKAIAKTHIIGNFRLKYTQVQDFNLLRSEERTERSEERERERERESVCVYVCVCVCVDSCNGVAFFQVAICKSCFGGGRFLLLLIISREFQ